MTWWMPVVGYVVGACATFVGWARMEFQNQSRHEMAHVVSLHADAPASSRDREVADWIKSHGGLLSSYDKAEILGESTLAAIFWPGAWICAFALIGLRRLNGWLTDGMSEAERQWRKDAADRAELAALRAQARELELPYPEKDYAE